MQLLPKLDAHSAAQTHQPDRWDPNGLPLGQEAFRSPLANSPTSRTMRNPQLESEPKGLRVVFAPFQPRATRRLVAVIKPGALWAIDNDVWRLDARRELNPRRGKPESSATEY